MSELKNGDKVRVVKNITDHGFSIGEIVIYGTGALFWKEDLLECWFLEEDEYESIINNKLIESSKPTLRGKVVKMIEEAELRVEELEKLEQTSLVANDIEMLLHDIETYKNILK